MLKFSCYRYHFIVKGISVGLRWDTGTVVRSHCSEDSQTTVPFWTQYYQS